MQTTNCHQQLWHCLHQHCHCLWWEDCGNFVRRYIQGPGSATLWHHSIKQLLMSKAQWTIIIGIDKNHECHMLMLSSAMYRKLWSRSFSLLDDIFFNGKLVDCHRPFHHVNINEFNSICQSTSNKWMITKKIITMRKNSNFNGKVT